MLQHGVRRRCLIIRVGLGIYLPLAATGDKHLGSKVWTVTACQWSLGAMYVAALCEQVQHCTQQGQFTLSLSSSLAPSESAVVS